MARVSKSKARLVMEITGPSEGVAAAVQVIVRTASQCASVHVSYPEPVVLEPVAARKRKAEA